MVLGALQRSFGGNKVCEAQLSPFYGAMRRNKALEVVTEGV